MIKDINPAGMGLGDSQNIVELNGVVLFTASDGSHGYELWKTDGTEAGTSMVKDINPGSDSSSVRSGIVIGGTYFFEARDGGYNYELWKSDGTEAGTTLVKDINPGASGSRLKEMVEFNGVLYFRASDGAHGDELWKSDGTEAGTVMVKDIYPGTTSGSPDELTVANDILFFEARDNNTHYYELWKTDGTEVGTVPLDVPRLGRTVVLADAICFEVAYDGLVRSAVLAGGEIIVVQTNNASFGLTQESVQQLAMTRLRAVEHGRTAIQISTVGVSGVIAPDGVVLARTGLFEADQMIETVPLRSTITLADRLGVWPQWAATLVAALALASGLATARRDRKRARPGVRP